VSVVFSGSPADGQQPLPGRLRRGQGLDVQIGD